MNRSLRDVALLLVDRLEAFLAGDAQALEDLRAALGDPELPWDTVAGALGWLRAGVSGEAEELVPAEPPGDPGRRVLSREERRVLSPEAFGFLLRMAADGRLAADQLEVVLARLGGNEFPVDLDEVQELAWRVATGESESESDLGASETTIH